MTLLRAAALLVPRDLRRDWLREWQSELFYVPRDQATAFARGAFRDALWLRRRAGAPRLDSPRDCLLALAVIAAISFAIAPFLPTPSRLSIRPTEALVLALAETAVLLPLTRLAIGGGPSGPAAPFRHRLRGWTFFVAKTLLIQPIVAAGLLTMHATARFVPIAPPLVTAGWIFVLRWAIADQRRRCPVCLRRLTDPVRIGAPSRTLLDWYGAESLCDRGHGRLENSETPVSYSEGRRWSPFDRSWSALFHL